VDAEYRFRAIFDVAYPALRRYGFHRGYGASEVDDLVAATFEVAWRKLDAVPADDPVPWLIAVMRNHVRNRQRADHRARELTRRLPPAPVSYPGEAPSLESGAIAGALSALSDDDREILQLIAWDGLTPTQAAIILSLSPVATRSRLHRARYRLAALLGDDGAVQRGEASRQNVVTGEESVPTREVPNG
jgi:RNA polymerase sigma factor (sigma-70 family)